MKKFLATATTLALLVPSLALAAYNDVTLTTDTILSVNSSDITITGSSAVVESAVVGATTIVLTMPTSSHIELRSATGTALTASDTTIQTVNTCSTGNTNLSFNNTGDSTITETVTVGSAHCTLSSGSGSGGGSSFGGGGGGGGGVVTVSPTPAPTPTPTPTPSPTPSASNADLGALLAQLRSLIAIFQSLGGTVTPAMSAFLNASPNASFVRDLKVGATGDDVKGLQVFLNTHGYAVASSGPGSPGNETTRFGAATRAALAKFQKANGISPAVGYFGAKTRAAVNGM